MHLLDVCINIVIHIDSDGDVDILALWELLMIDAYIGHHCKVIGSITTCRRTIGLDVRLVQVDVKPMNRVL